MKRSIAVFLLAGTLTAGSLDPGTAARLKQAREQIARNPGHPDGHIAAALTLVKAARSSGDSSYLDQAEKEVAAAFQPSDDNFEAKKARVAVRLAQHRYDEALAEAQALNQKVPDDNQLYGYIADAQIALGNFAAAEKAAQWMIDQRSGNAAALQRGARLREILGYTEPSLEWWNAAFRLTSFADAEERAWILVNISRVQRNAGRAAEAEKSARRALELIPDYALARDALAALKDGGLKK
jgi:tetratricopeptide (TPR) repeat protein